MDYQKKHPLTYLLLRGDLIFVPHQFDALYSFDDKVASAGIFLVRLLFRF